MLSSPELTAEAFSEPQPVPPVPGPLLEYLHIGHLLQLYTNGVQVPPVKIAPATLTSSGSE